MALTSQASNWISNTQSTAREMLALRSTSELLRARATVNGLAAVITDVAIQEVQRFSHLSRAELIDALTVYTEYITFMGDPNDPTSRAGKLLKLEG